MGRDNSIAPLETAVSFISNIIYRGHRRAIDFKVVWPGGIFTIRLNRQILTGDPVLFNRGVREAIRRQMNERRITDPSFLPEDYLTIEHHSIPPSELSNGNCQIF